MKPLDIGATEGLGLIMETFYGCKLLSYCFVLFVLVIKPRQCQPSTSSASCTGADLNPSCPPTVIFTCRQPPTFALVEKKCCLVCGENVPNVTCTAEGKVYQDGEYWTPSTVPRDLVQGNPVPVACVDCKCAKGVVQCFNQQSLCPSLKCEKASVVPGACCPACDDDDGNGGSGGSGLLIEPIVTNETCRDELDNTRQHQECWNWVYEGQVTCLRVCCNDSRVVRIPKLCPPVRDCRDGELPYKRPLDCCPFCRTNTTDSKPDVTEPIPYRECVGNLPFKIYLFKSSISQRKDAWAFEEVNSRNISIIAWKHRSSRTVRLWKTTSTQEFFQHKDSKWFYYRGRTTLERMSSLSSNSTIVEALKGCRTQCSRLAVSFLEPTMTLPSCL